MEEGRRNRRHPLGNRCLLFRRLKGPIGECIGQCDVDGASTNCDGDVNLCDKPESLREYFRKIVEGTRKEIR
jgi:hypothetical protein